MRNPLLLLFPLVYADMHMPCPFRAGVHRGVVVVASGMGQSGTNSAILSVSTRPQESVRKRTIQAILSSQAFIR